jgi:Bacterial Ig-like domain (group 3)/FG-GAP-like repeat
VKKKFFWVDPAWLHQQGEITSILDGSASHDWDRGLVGRDSERSPMQQHNYLIIVFTLFLLSLGEIAEGDRFYSPTTYPTGELPGAAVARDFNHDGLLDLVTANRSDDNISVLLGLASGGFAAATNYAAGNQPFAIASADLDGDGEFDLAVTNSSDDSVSIFPGHGDGTFDDPTTFAVQTSPGGIVIADLNHDSILDLAVAVHGLTQANQGWAAVLLGLGDGSFQNAVLYPAGQNPLRLTNVDLNGDGDLDLAVADENATHTPNDLAILLGNGDGTFSAPLLSFTTGTASDVTATDLNGDGQLDLVIAGGENKMVSVRLGNGDGTFRSPRNMETSGAAKTVTLADLDSDTLPDLLVGGSDGANVLLGRGGARFRPATTFGVGTQFALAADFNNDGALDAVAAGDLVSVSLSLGKNDGTFMAARVYSGATTINTLTSGDFNRDGKVDLALGKEPANTIKILFGSTTGVFIPGVSFGTVEPSNTIAVDFNGDGRLDLCLASTTAMDSGANLYLGNGDGTFGAPQRFNAGTDPLAQVAADFNHDGRIDLATANAATQDISILLGNGDGTFQPPINYPAHRNPNVILAADFNSDGDLDLAVNNSSSARIGVYLGNGDGTFQNALELIAGAVTMVSGDFNRDHKIDLVLGGNPRLFLGNGDGTFQAGQFISFADGAMRAADINGDGRLDLVLASQQVHLLLGNGDGTFQDGTDHFPGALTLGLLEILDVNRDGALDVAVTDRLENVSVLLNTGGSRIALTSSQNPSLEGEEVIFTVTITPTFPDVGDLTGRVTFKDGSTILGTSRLRQGTASFSSADLAAGDHSISAIYSGSEIFNRRTSSRLSQVVNEM